MNAYEALPETYEDVCICFDRIRCRGARLISEWQDDGTIEVSWYEKGPEPYLTALYDQDSGQLLQAAML